MLVRGGEHDASHVEGELVLIRRCWGRSMALAYRSQRAVLSTWAVAKVSTSRFWTMWFRRLRQTVLRACEYFGGSLQPEACHPLLAKKASSMPVDFSAQIPQRGRLKAAADRQSLVQFPVICHA